MVKIDHVSQDLLLRLHDKKMAENVEPEKQKIKAKLPCCDTVRYFQAYRRNLIRWIRVLKQTVLEGYAMSYCA